MTDLTRLFNEMCSAWSDVRDPSGEINLTKCARAAALEKHVREAINVTQSERTRCSKCGDDASMRLHCSTLGCPLHEQSSKPKRDKCCSVAPEFVCSDCPGFWQRTPAVAPSAGVQTFTVQAWLIERIEPFAYWDGTSFDFDKDCWTTDPNNTPRFENDTSALVVLMALGRSNRVRGEKLTERYRIAQHEWPGVAVSATEPLIDCLKLVRKVLAKDKPMIGSRDETLLCKIDHVLSNATDSRVVPTASNK